MGMIMRVLIRPARTSRARIVAASGEGIVTAEKGSVNFPAVWMIPLPPEDAPVDDRIDTNFDVA
jgi:hypothetical protein